MFSKLMIAALLAAGTVSFGAAADLSDDDDSAASARGVVKAARQAEMSVAMSARISKMPYAAGDQFRAGATLVAFDCSRMKAELEALRAAERALDTNRKTTMQMFDHGAAGSLEVEVANADVERAEAEARAKQAQIDECVVSAPYSGYVVERFADPFETPSAGSPLLSIMDDAPREIKLIVPSRWLRWLAKGYPFDFKVEETGMSYPANVVRVGRSVDSVSRTVEVTARFEGRTPGAFAGMSGSAHFEPLSEE